MRLFRWEGRFFVIWGVDKYPLSGRVSSFLAACACSGKGFRRSQRLQFCKTCLHPLVIGKLSAYNIIRVFRPDGRMEDMRMKRKMMALLLALCLLPALAMAAVDITTMSGLHTFTDPEVTLTGAANHSLYLRFENTVKTVVLEDVTFAAPEYQDALTFKGDSVKVIFRGQNAITGGGDAIYAEGSVVMEPGDAAGSHSLKLIGGSPADSIGGTGIHTNGAVSITGDVTVLGGDGGDSDSNANLGGNGIWADGDVTITGDATVCGGNGGTGGMSAGDGIFTHGSVTITGDVTIAGGDGYNGGHGYGICAYGNVTITGDATITGGDGKEGMASGGHAVAASGRVVLSGDMVLTGGDGRNSGGLGLVAMKGAEVSGNITLNGGDGGKNSAAALRVYGGNTTISGSVTAIGGDGNRGGDGVWFGYTEHAPYETYTIDGALTAVGGNGKGDRGGHGIRVDDGKLVISNYVTATGGTGSPNGRGVHADDVELTVLNLCGYESDDGKTWRETVRNTTRYYKTRAKLPSTGDASMLGAWICLLGASAAGMKLRRKK